MLFDELLDQTIEEKAETIISRKLQPLAVLEKYSDVEVLTFGEVLEIFRTTKDKLRGAVNDGKFPAVQIGRDTMFPKYLIVAVLTGAWKPETEKKADVNLKGISPKVLDFAS